MADDKLPKCGCGTAPVQEWGQSYRLDSRVVCPACGTATRWFSSDDAGARTAWTRALSSPGLEALQWILPMAKGFAHEHPVGRNMEIVRHAEEIAALQPAAGTREDEEKRPVLCLICDEPVKEFGGNSSVPGGMVHGPHNRSSCYEEWTHKPVGWRRASKEGQHGRAERRGGGED